MLRYLHGASWLSLTPEPERELPEAVASMRARGRPGAADVARERARIERLVLRGSERAWLAYLGSVVALIEVTDPAAAAARGVAIDVIANHHALRQGLPGGRAAARAEEDRRRLRRLACDRREGTP